jgi:isoleucyl-tRNA synthetase
VNDSSAQAAGPPPEGDLPAVCIAGKSPHAKCERCWNYRESVGRDAEHPTLCERCSRVIREIGPAAGS